MFLFLIPFTIRQQFLIIAPVIMGGREISRPYQSSFFMGGEKKNGIRKEGARIFL